MTVSMVFPSSRLQLPRSKMLKILSGEWIVPKALGPRRPVLGAWPTMRAGAGARCSGPNAAGARRFRTAIPVRPLSPQRHLWAQVDPNLEPRVPVLIAAGSGSRYAQATSCLQQLARD